MSSQTGMVENGGSWTTVIRPRDSVVFFPVRELWAYRDLIGLFVRRDFVSVYAQTILGPLWFFIQPVLTTLIFTVFSNKIGKIPTEGMPPFLFNMVGVVAWTYFAGCINRTSSTFVNNSGLFSKVYFPRLVMPVTAVLSNLITFAIQFALMLGFIGYFWVYGADVRLTGWAILTPFLLLQMAALGLGVGILVSALTTRYRDLAFLISYGVTLWMFLTPVIWPLSVIPARYIWLCSLNPMAGVMETFRVAFLGAGRIYPEAILIGACVTVAVLVLGLFLFHRVERTFLDTV